MAVASDNRPALAPVRLGIYQLLQLCLLIASSLVLLLPVACCVLLLLPLLFGPPFAIVQLTRPDVASSPNRTSSCILLHTSQYSTKASHTMSHTMRCTLVVLIALALFAAGCNVEASKARPPRNNEISTMADAIKYLQDLDVYYGDRARVRFGKRGSLMQLRRMLESGNNNYNNNENMNDNNNNNGGGELMHAAAEDEMF